MPPATPSRPPMESQKSFEKARDSPVVVRHTPKRPQPSPMKLEVGQGAFYFSIELPPNKITPKKSGTTSKSQTPKGEDTPTRTRTPSPLKKASPTKENAVSTPTRATRSPLKRDETTKQSPARPLFGTPTRARMHKQDTDPRTPARTTPSPRKNHSAVKQSPAKIATVTPKRKDLLKTPGSNRPGSPIKRSIEQDDSPVDPLKTSARLARELLSGPEETLRMPPERLVDLRDEHAPANLVATATDPAPHHESTKQAPPAIKCPENIGHLMASLISNTTSTCDWGAAYNHDIISPIPTPLRKASEKLKLGESPSFLRMSANGTTTMTNADHASDVSKRVSLNLHEPASADPRQDESNQIESSTCGSTEAALPSSITTDHTTGASGEPRPALPLRAASLGSFNTLNATREAPAPPHRPLLFPKRRSETLQKAPSQQEHQVRWQDMETASLKPLPASHQRRVGTDPSVLLKMQKDMANLEATMRRSAGVVDPAFCGPLNLNELPAMSNDYFVRGQQDIRSPGVVGTPKTLSRANSDNPSIATVQANGVRGTSNSLAPLKVSGTPGIPRLKSSAPTSTQATRDRLLAAKKETPQRMGATKTAVPERSRPRSKTTVSVTGKSAAVTSTPRKTPATPAKPVAPPGTTTLSSPHSRIPSVNAAKPRMRTQSVPQTGTKPLSNASGHSKAVAALKERLPNVPTAPVNTRPVPIRKPVVPSTTATQVPSAGPRPYEQEFASAGDIADRLANWHDEDRKKAQINRPTVAARNTPAKIQTGGQADESTTPDGSPAKILTPAKVPASTRTSKALPPAKDVKSRPSSIKPSAPSTPRSKPSAPAPKTPAPKTPAPAPRNAVAANNNLRQPITAAKTPVNRRIPVLDRNATRTPSKAIVSSLDQAIDRKIAEDARRGMEYTPGGNRLRDLLDAKSMNGGVVQVLEEEEEV
ncbi:uncharacterized protein J4E92_003660 [Alternaria infectoria]|uniref:uncharacterized protein n=1 Tax=Alternaria infectoria TaxID=45303 RepID=UPI00221FEAEA|nr:uncharacterized protein J4E92_003660 [Alternaria infectoria]KAI4933990.1 hypothetical protein J4E92_003660 [Alternaria infectoria]